ncbi:MAG: carbon starvation protein A [Planctomycetes bacterium]|nr:carbon starvation protein A [Planctomycetota bacterium]
MRRALPWIGWGLVAALGAGAFAVMALTRGESINAAWLLTAALCTYAVGYRFYSRFIANRLFALDDRRATPAVRLNDGHDYVPTGKWVVFGHHFAAIAGAGPLVGPILAAQFGWLPGTLWIIIGVVVAGAVQDFVILCASMRRDGKSLGQMARDEVGTVAGWLSMFGVFAIIMILIAVLAMVVVNALAESPWGCVSLALTIPIALLMGVWMRWLRPGKVIEASLIGLVLLGLSLWAGQWAAQTDWIRDLFTFTTKEQVTQAKVWVALTLIGYGFVASVLPVWLLLAPRDYLSSFVKIGTVAMLALGIFLVLPDLAMPAVNPQFAEGGRFADGKGPVFAGGLFPFAFITIACGVISGFHALVASGTTPKLISKESDARAIGYGAMCMESFVAVMAMIAACVLTPGVYFAMNSPDSLIGKDVAGAAATITSWGFSVSAEELRALAVSIEEPSILSKPGGAPCLAVGMAKIFSAVTGERLMAFWYHFAIMFEALFILTTIDAGTRVGRFIFQDLVGHVWKPFKRVSWQPAVWIASAVVVAGWGYFLIAGIRDPLGGIYTLWPLFGIANQVLAAIALCVGTTIIVKMGKARMAWITIAPLLWLVVVTETAGYHKLSSSEPGLGFIAKARQQDEVLARLRATPLPSDPVAAKERMADEGKAERIAFNNRLNAGLCVVFMGIIVAILVSSARECWLVLRGRRPLSDAAPAGMAP